MNSVYVSKKTYKKGDIIAIEGENTTDCYVLLSGWVGIFKNKIKVDDFNIPGTVFGEISFLLDKRRTAHIIALAESEVMSFRGDVEDIIRNYPNIAKKILVSLADKLRKTTENFVLVIDEDIQQALEGSEQ
ncbi:MAG TPA: Crp/Fnr family transcriptional regulator [Ignavibacteriales bacterium]|jgi:CRP-like cAMP-binding protein|nr:Crp/Fnr family transcriptional regulator [Ignavibacteriales bacterium]